MTKAQKQCQQLNNETRKKRQLEQGGEYRDEKKKNALRNAKN